MQRSCAISFLIILLRGPSLEVQKAHLFTASKMRLLQRRKTEKNIKRQKKTDANAETSILPTMSQRNQHLTHAMLRKPATTTPKQYPGQRPSICNRVPQDPAILLDLQKHYGSLNASLALARSSHIVVLMNKLSRCNCYVALGIRKWSEEGRTSVGTLPYDAPPQATV